MNTDKKQPSFNDLLQAMNSEQISKFADAMVTAVETLRDVAALDNDNWVGAFIQDETMAHILAAQAQAGGYWLADLRKNSNTNNQ